MTNTEITPSGIDVEDVLNARGEAINAVVIFSGELETHRLIGDDALNGYEGTFPVFLDRLIAAREAGATFKDISTALKADEPKAGKGQPKRHLYSAEGALSSLEPLLVIRNHEGDLPQGWVWRPDRDGMIALREGEQSVTRVVLDVVNPGEAAVALLKDYMQRHGLTEPVYGKKIANACVNRAGTKEEAVEALSETNKAIQKLVAEAKKERDAIEKGPKDATVFLKAASKQMDKAQEAISGGAVADLGEVRRQLLALAAVIEAEIKSVTAASS